MPENPCAGCVYLTPISAWIGYGDGEFAGAEASGCLGSCCRPDFNMDPDSSYVHEDGEAPCAGEWYEYEGKAEKLEMTPLEIWNV